MTINREQDRHIVLGREVIRAEARALDEAADNLGADFVETVETIAAQHGRVVVTGIGKSGQVARKIAAMLASTGTPAVFLHAGEAVHGDLGALRKGDIALVVSHSGETPEIVALLPILKRMDMTIIAITDAPRSTLSLVASIVLQPGSVSRSDPIGLAPTASAAAAMAIGDALALAIAQHRGLSPKDFEHRPGGALGKLMESVYGKRADAA
jgi:arabinose-5-phosphate isomerase